MAVEYRGCRGLVIAPVTQDNAEGYTTGAVVPLAPLGEVSKSVDTSSAAHYYDNTAQIIIDSEGEDTVAFTVAIPTDEILALITGRTYNSETKQFIEAPRKQDYFAVGYILGEIGEGEEESYVWRYKGQFNIPDEGSKTKDDSTDATNMSLEYKGIYTQHKFANGGGTGVSKPVKAMRMKASDIAENDFFGQVITPDTTLPVPVASYVLSITQAENTTVTVTRGGTELADGASLSAGDVLTISVTGGTVTVNGNSFSSGNTYTVAGNVAVVSTAEVSG